MKWKNSYLDWDATGERFYETGVKYGVLYLLTVEGSDVPLPLKDLMSHTQMA